MPSRLVSRITATSVVRRYDEARAGSRAAAATSRVVSTVPAPSSATSPTAGDHRGDRRSSGGGRVQRHLDARHAGLDQRARDRRGVGRARSRAGWRSAPGSRRQLPPRGGEAREREVRAVVQDRALADDAERLGVVRRDFPGAPTMRTGGRLAELGPARRAPRRSARPRAAPGIRRGSRPAAGCARAPRNSASGAWAGSASASATAAAKMPSSQSASDVVAQHGALGEEREDFARHRRAVSPRSAPGRRAPTWCACPAGRTTPSKSGSRASSPAIWVSSAADHVRRVVLGDAGQGSRPPRRGGSSAPRRVSPARDGWARAGRVPSRQPWRAPTMAAGHDVEARRLVGGEARRRWPPKQGAFEVLSGLGSAFMPASERTIADRGSRHAHCPGAQDRSVPPPSPPRSTRPKGAPARAPGSRRARAFFARTCPLGGFALRLPSALLRGGAWPRFFRLALASASPFI